MLLPQLMTLAIRASAILFAASTVTANPIHTSESLESATTDVTIRRDATLATRDGTFSNPIVKGAYADPWMFQYDGNYYLILAAGGGVGVRKSSNLAEFNVDRKIVWTPPAPFTDLWAPEMHRIDGEFYIYVALAKDKKNSEHRMYVLKGTSKTDPAAPFTFVGKLNTPDDNWAIDGTVMQYKNGQNYFIWSGWSGAAAGNIQNLYIAKMDSPTKLAGNRAEIHSPGPAWQRSGNSGINEGPQILTHNDRTFLVYSTAGSWTKDYNLALMGIDNGADPMKASNWWKKDNNPVFKASNVAFGTGHASFVTDRKGTPYIIYHAMEKPDGGWSGRTVRAQAFKWNSDGSPWFPEPVALGAQLPLPA